MRPFLYPESVRLSFVLNAKSSLRVSEVRGMRAHSSMPCMPRLLRTTHPLIDFGQLSTSFEESQNGDTTQPEERPEQNNSVQGKRQSPKTCTYRGQGHGRESQRRMPTSLRRSTRISSLRPRDPFTARWQQHKTGLHNPHAPRFCRTFVRQSFSYDPKTEILG